MSITSPYDIMPAYTYTALPDDRSIRMLTLESGEFDAPLKGRLKCTDIDELGLYEPMSYVWGSLSRAHSIAVDNAKIMLTASLCNALRRLRLPDRERRVWVDQICINQDDRDERSRQVQFMNTIYKNAHHVLVWLGQDDQEVARSAFRLVHELAETFNNQERRAKFHLDHTDGLSKRFKDDWIPIILMTQLLWFTRAWIVQEIGTSAPATLFWGQAKIDWRILHTVCEELTTYHHLRKNFDIQTAEIKYIFQRFIEPERSSRHANRFSFIYELHRARHLKVTDPRDRVFAMLGHYSIRHGNNLELRAFKADYEKTPEEVYTEVAARALKGDTESLITLAAVQHMNLPSKIDTSSAPPRLNTLPSWVPDWRTFQSHILSEPTSPHRASGAKVSDLHIDQSSQILSLRGIMIDTIEACSEGLKPKTFQINNSKQNPTLKQLWQTICGHSSFNLSERYINGDSALFAYTQTLSNGCVAISWQEHRPYDEVSEQEWLAHGAAYLTKAIGQDNDVSLQLRDLAAEQGPGKWSRAAHGASSNRAFARTAKGYYVLGPKIIEVGDVICVLLGGKMPFCLRPWEGKYLLVGECYVHGLMKGEAEALHPESAGSGIFELI